VRGETMYKRNITAVVIAFLIGCMSLNFFYHATAKGDPLSPGTSATGCLKCHQGIDSIGPAHEGLACEDCHSGDPEADKKDLAHTDMHKNPGDLNIVEETCGLCHDEIVAKVKKSLHSTSAGIISGARYLWAAQKQRNSLYSVRAVKDDDGDTPEKLDAMKSLDQIPHFKDSNEPVDDYLRNQCLRCHLWTEGAKRRGDYRSSGCSACHVLYADDGLSHSNDKTIPKDEPGHPVKHEITKKIHSEQCVHCHNRGGRTGVSFLGLMEADGYGTPFNPDGSKQQKLHGKFYNHLQQDLHLQAGLHCIDCHTMNDIHGDGNIYGKKEHAVEIECTNCHGTPDQYSTLTTARGNPMENLEKQNDQVILKGKIDEKMHTVPQIAGLAERGVLPHAMQIEKHIEKLECYACHARWAPQCYGCHAKMDMRKKGFDWVDQEKDQTYHWQESRSYLRWESPTLGINTEKKVSPFIPGCQAIFTQINEDGENIVSNKVFTTAHGYSGIAHNPIQPHTLSKKPRTCEDCHSNPKALGLGNGHYISKLNGVDIPFELERIVDEDGNQIQDTSHDGSRPFNKEEMDQINRVNVCLGCHQETPTLFWKKVKEKWGEAQNNKTHKDILKSLLIHSTEKESTEEKKFDRLLAMIIA